MILELVWPYIPVAVVWLFGFVAMRPVLRLIHVSALTPRRAIASRSSRLR